MVKSSWIILWVAFSAGVVGTLIQFSIPPILPVFQDQYQVSYASAGLLMSLFALTTLLAAVPSGFIVRRYGVRTIGLLGLGILFLGVVCCFAASTFPILLTGRIIQGIGFGLVSVAAPSAIGQFIAPQMMSIAMGIWSTWVPLGSLLMFLFAPIFVTQFHIDAYWIVLLCVLVVVFIIYAVLIPRTVETKIQKGSSEGTMENDDVTRIPPKTALKSELMNSNIWWVAGAFASFTFAFFSFNTWISSYLTTSVSMSLTTASIIPMLVSLCMIGSNVYSGILLRRFGNHLLLFLLSPLVMACLWPMFMSDSAITLYISAILLGAIGGFVPTIVFASAPLMAKGKETVGIAMSIVIIGENLGILIGPEVFGIVRDYTGDFVVGFWMLVLVGLFTIVACYRIWKSETFKLMN